MRVMLDSPELLALALIAGLTIVVGLALALIEASVTAVWRAWR